MTAFYSVLHFLVDGVCAAAMFGTGISGKGRYFLILLYNFCAFALQMPLGVVLDALNAEGTRNREEALRNAGSGPKRRNWNLMTAIAGVLCTIAGAVTHPVLLGIGNALFHVGGGVGTICGSREEEEPGRKVRDRAGEQKRLLMRLGIFVAPGALGLYLGMLLAKSGYWSVGSVYGSVVMLLFCGAVLCAGLRRAGRGGRQNPGQERPQGAGMKCLQMTEITQTPDAEYGPVTGAAGIPESDASAAAKGILLLSICCLLVVILRSYLGMAVTFPWKTGIFAGLAAVLAVAGGKTAGGFLAAWGGVERTAAVSLVLASVCYLFSSVMPVGLAALFLFNMTMPITLYWMVLALPQKPGFAFGFLTFALFLGFLPGYLDMQTGLAGNVIGSAGSLFSCLILAAGIGAYRRNGKERA